MDSRTALQQIDDLIAELEASVAANSVSVKAPETAATAATADSSSKKEKKEKKEKKPAPEPAPAAAPAPKADALNANHLDLRVGVITTVERHATADKLYCETIDVGEGEPRAIASGLVPHYTLEEMQNRRCIVMCNLKARNLVGFKSHGMVLCAVKADETGKEKVEFVDPPADAKPGDRIVGEGLVGEPLTPNQVDKLKAFEAIASGYTVNEQGEAMWRDVRLVIAGSGVVCTAPTVRSGIMR